MFYFFLLLNALIIGFLSNTNINYPVVVILTKGGVNLWKGVRLRPEENSQSNVNILQVLGSSDCGNILWPGPDVINNRPLDPWDHEVGALTNYLLLHTNKPVKDHRPVTSIHVKESRVDYSSTDCETHAKLAKPVENLRRHSINLNLL